MRFILKKQIFITGGKYIQMHEIMHAFICEIKSVYLLMLLCNCMFRGWTPSSVWSLVAVPGCLGDQF